MEFIDKRRARATAAIIYVLNTYVLNGGAGGTLEHPVLRSFANCNKLGYAPCTEMGALPLSVLLLLLSLADEQVRLVEVLISQLEGVESPARLRGLSSRGVARAVRRSHPHATPQPRLQTLQALGAQTAVTMRL
jgi:hypothetical protein